MTSNESAGETLPVEEYYCRACGWTEPVFQAGDPALCSNCSVEYEADPLSDGWEPRKRIRTWPRCAGWNADGSRCDRRTDAEFCHDHTEESA